MTDKELSTLGERLYEAVLATPLPAGMVSAIGRALREGIPWAHLPPPLKLGVFKIVASSRSKTDLEESEQAEAQPPAARNATAVAAASKAGGCIEPAEEEANDGVEENAAVAPMREARADDGDA